MKYQGIRKIHEGRFITRYDVDYVTAEGNPKTYEMISRDGNISDNLNLSEIHVPQATMIVEDVCLYRSDHGEQGMEYTVIGRRKQGGE